MKTIVTTALLALLLMCSVAAQSWDFGTDGNTEGWYTAHSVASLRTTGGSLVGEISGGDPYIYGPRYPDIDATVNRYLHIRIKTTAGGDAEFFWGTAAEPYHKAGREIAFPVIGDGQFHEYIVDMSANAQWTGSVNSIRLDPAGGDSGHFEIDFIHVLAVAPPILMVSSPSAADRFAWTGEQVSISATIRNTGYSDATNVRATVVIPGQAVLGSALQTVTSIGAGEQVTMTWQVRADSESASEMTLSVAADSPAGTIVKSAPLVVSAARPSLTSSASPKAQAWKDAAGNAVIENQSIRMVFVKSAYGYGVAELYVLNGTGWNLMAASCPLSRVSYKRPNGALSSVALTPNQVTTINTAGSALLQFGFSCPDADGASWQGLMSFTLGDFDETVKVNYRLQPTASRSLMAWMGPRLCAGNRSFGSTKSQAIFPGLEWLVGDEQSSNTLESDEAHRLRVVPHPYKVTVPLMAVSGNGAVVGLLWNALRKWDASNAYASAKFSSPNWFEAQNNHLMELFAPSVPTWCSENSDIAGTPYSLTTSAQLSMEAYYYARQGGEVLDAVDKWYALYGAPALPGGDGLLEAGLATARAGLMTALWNPTVGGWPHAVTWAAGPSPEMAQDLFADSLTETNPATKAAMRSIVDQAVQSAVSAWGYGGLGSNANTHLPGYRLPYFIGHLYDLVARMQSDATGIMSSQRPDGGWYVTASSPDLFTPNSEELGSCAQNAHTLLRHARVTGSTSSKSAGLKALGAMNQFAVPRAAQCWEVPQHAPDVLAAAWAVGAYTEGYLLTGNAAYLAKARYWARAGLPFVYTWRATDRAVMDYATIPVFGCTNFTWSWFGLPVQWNGMVYAYFVHQFAPYDSTHQWRTIAEGITRSCVQQMNISPYLGTYGDSLNLIYSNTANGVFINPDSIYKCARQAMDAWGEIDVRKLVGASRTVYVSTGGRIVLGCVGGLGQTVLRVRYPLGETCHILACGTGSPSAIYRNGQLLPKVSDVDAVSEGWRYSSSYNRVIIKAPQTLDVQTYAILPAGVSYTPVAETINPAGAKALPNGSLVSFSGFVTAGTDALSDRIYVESVDRTAGIRVVPAAAPLMPVRTGDQVIVMGTLSTVYGERVVALADVQLALSQGESP